MGISRQRTFGFVKARILISCESAIVSAVGWKPGSASRRKTHMPDCESTRKRRKRSIVTLDRTAFPKSLSGLFDLSCFERQPRGGLEARLSLAPPPHGTRG